MIAGSVRFLPALAALCALTFAGCRSPRSVYGPLVDNVGSAPGGQPAAIYEIPLGSSKGGQVQVWTDGIMADGLPTGESRKPESVPRSFRVGFVVRNDAETEMSINPLEVHLVLEDIPDLRPREVQTVSVPPGQSTEMLLRYPLPGRFEQRPPDSYDVAWTVHFGSATYQQVTPFSRKEKRGFVPKPLDSSEPHDPPYLNEQPDPAPVGVPWGGDTGR